MYFKGQESYDAKLVWDSYSDRLIKEAQRRGITVDDTQHQFDRAKQVGNSIRQADYIGGYPISTETEPGCVAGAGRYAGE